MGHDLLGALIVKANTPGAVTDENVKEFVVALNKKAADCDLDLLTFFKLQCLYYLSDAGSYQHIKDNYMQAVTRGLKAKHSILYVYNYIPTGDCFLKIIAEVERVAKLEQQIENLSMLRIFSRLQKENDLWSRYESAKAYDVQSEAHKNRFLN